MGASPPLHKTGLTTGQPLRYSPPMIKRNMLKAGDVIEWIDTHYDEPAHYLLAELTCKCTTFAIWRAFNLTRGGSEIIEINRMNANCWRRHGAKTKRKQG